MLEIVLTALMVAVLAAAGFVLLGWLWRQIAVRYRRRTPFADQMIYPAGERFRGSLRRADKLLGLYLGAVAVAVVVFGLLFAGLSWRGPDPIGDPAPVWLLVAIGVLCAAAVGGAGYHVWHLWKERRKNQLAMDADIAVGNALKRTAARGGCVFHHVATGQSVIDHVVVAPYGAFVVNVAMKTPLGGEAEFSRTQLKFNGVTDNHPLGDAVRKSKWLSKRLAKVVGHPVKVRSVIVVPGWRVKSQGTENHLVVNERNVAMISGWTQEDAYLMEEEVAHIAQHLSRQCRDTGVRPPKK